MGKIRWILTSSILLNVVLIFGLLWLVQRLGGVNFFLHRLQTGGIAGIYENRKQLLENLPIDNTSIIFLGDSITEHGQWGELTGYQEVKNRGIAGETTYNLLQRLAAITEAQPKAVFLMIGVNDFLFVGQEEIVKNYKTILHQIATQTPHTKVFLQSVLPVNPEVKGMVFSNEAIRSLNSEIQKLAIEQGYSFINLHDLLTDDTGKLDAQYTADGIHLNGKAYLIWKKEVMPIIHQLVEEKSNINTK